MSLVPSVQSNYANRVMATPRHLSNAPIIEALVDFRVAASEGLGLQALKASLESTDFGYYLKSPISEGNFQFRMPADGQPPESSAESFVSGFRLHSNDECYVAQWMLGGFSLSRLPPYQDWPSLVAEFKRVWTIYLERCRPQAVTRVATRFINNLRLPIGAGDSYQTYLNRVVEVPAEAPQAVEAFFQRFQLVDEPLGARVWLSLAQKGVSDAQPARLH